MPEPTVTTFGDGVLIFKRRARRQWQEGWCRNNILLWNQNLEPELPDVPRFQAVCAPVFTPIRQAVKALTDDPQRIAIACSKNYWVAKLEDESINLFRNRLPVAVFVRNNANLFYTHAPCTDFESEIQELMRGPN